MVILIIFTQVVRVHLGVTLLIAHVKVGQMHAALESKVLVVSAKGKYNLLNALGIYGKNVFKQYIKDIDVTQNTPFKRSV